MGFVEIDSIIFVLHVYTTCSCIMQCFVLCCVVHTMLVIKCLLDVFVCIFGLH